MPETELRPTDRFEHAAVIGTGMMGPGIALTLALAGVPATIVSRSAEGAAQGLEKARAQARFLAARGLAEAEAAERAASLLGATAEFAEAVGGADIVVESAPEDLDFKQRLFARMDALARPATVLASNTSGLSITAIANACARPERVLTAHFWNPPHLMPLVEIVMGERTAPEAAEAVHALLAAGGKTPVIVRKDRPGQLGNRLQMALAREAAHIIAEGIATAEDVDTVVKNGFGLRMPAYGLLEHLDVVGLDLGLRVADYVARDLFSQPRAPEYFHGLVRRGDLGAKTGRGFYDWSVKSAAAVRKARDEFLVEVLRYRRAAIGRLPD
jgi:3-hydroxybutyryl-CoA dehydrogenase